MEKETQRGEFGYAWVVVTSGNEERRNRKKQKAGTLLGNKDGKEYR